MAESRPVNLSDISREVACGRILLALRHCSKGELPKLTMSRNGKKVTCLEPKGENVFTEARNQGVLNNEWIIDCRQVGCIFYTADKFKPRPVKVDLE